MVWHISCKFQGLFRSKSESSLVPREDKVEGKKKFRRKHRHDDMLKVPSSFPKSSKPISMPKRPIPWNNADAWRPKSWSPNERTAQLLLDNDDQVE